MDLQFVSALALGDGGSVTQGMLVEPTDEELRMIDKSQLKRKPKVSL